MRRVAYFNKKRLFISDYDPEKHKGKIFCAEGHLLIAKRGKIKAHHFCHKGKISCDSDKKMGPWHIWWQDRILPEMTEFRIKKDGKLKIADAFNSIDGRLRIIEFQKSIIPSDEIQFRESFYSSENLLSFIGKEKILKPILIWIFDCSNCDIDITKRNGKDIEFYWVKGSKYLFAAKKSKIFLDFGKKELIELTWRNNGSKSTKLKGTIWDLEDIDKTIFKGILKQKLSTDQKRTNLFRF